MRHSFFKQQGIAALSVTLLLVFIATVAALYANRNSFILQKTSVNYYQQAKALEAAEAGANEFVNRIIQDMDILSDADPTNDNTTVILTNTLPTGGTCAGQLGAVPYAFRAAYVDSSNPLVFANGRYFSNRVDWISTPAGTTADQAYRVRASLQNGRIDMISEGCADDAVANPSITAPSCSNSDQPKATVRRSIAVTGGVTIGGSALLVKTYMDARGSITIDKPDPSKPDPQCAILSGESYSFGGVQQFWGVPTAQLNSLATMSENDFFKSVFGGTSIEDMRVEAQCDNCGTGGADTSLYITDGSCPASIPSSVKLIWYEGDITVACNFAAKAPGQNLNVIVNGNVKQNANITMDGLFYAKNVYQNGQVKVQGQAAIAGHWDIAAPGTTLTNYIGQPVVNGKTDATNPALSTTHSGLGSVHVTFDRSKITPPKDPSTTVSSSSWIDF